MFTRKTRSKVSLTSHFCHLSLSLGHMRLMAPSCRILTLKAPRPMCWFKQNTI
ncbi:hypothetical protein D918_07560 [Trichuris suis]|nr:hypothetical protein D918_07560 [Trichuris suis]